MFNLIYQIASSGKVNVKYKRCASLPINLDVRLYSNETISSGMLDTAVSAISIFRKSNGVLSPDPGP